ncbi:hypothetical protein AMTR_s00023p00226770 [Amborella trichopoda]|uniref:Uncharacterized protein n=1 Tax=Amborella trichopoda TaxID=13333 RepID=W1NKJ9_AMBTC|nr:hypothetical protein AMTR_s00023p00226770 [Amborella trichopoda]
MIFRRLYSLLRLPMLVLRSPNLPTPLHRNSPWSNKWKPSKAEKKQLIREKAAQMVKRMQVEFKGTFKVVEEVLERYDIGWALANRPVRMRSRPEHEAAALGAELLFIPFVADSSKVNMGGKDLCPS